MTTLTAATGTKKATIRQGQDGYGDIIFRATLSQEYNNGTEMVERFIESKTFTTEKKANAWAKKQLA